MRSKKEEADTKFSMKRSLRSLPLTYAPSLLFTHGEKHRDQTFLTLSDGGYHVKSVPEMRHMKCIASCYGWLLLQSYYSTEGYLFNPNTLSKISLPPLIDCTFNVGVLTSPPTESNCVVVLFSCQRQLFAFCRIGCNNWIEQKLRYKNNEGQECVFIGLQSVHCGGKIYLFHFYGFAVIEFRDNYTFASVEQYDRKYIPTSIPECTTLSYFFVESCGEIFQAIGSHVGFSDIIIQKFDVFKLDLSKMDWVKVESLGNRIFLLGRYSTSSSAEDIGVKGNCIYFTMSGYTWLFRFDMDNETITPTLPKFSHWGGPFWIVPDCKMKVTNALVKVEKTRYEVKEETNKWKDLRPEVLELILGNLYLGGYLCFRLTCKPWFATQQLRLESSSLPGESVSQQLPWLLSLSGDYSLCHFHHPVYIDKHVISIPELAGAIVRHAKYGWLLMSRGQYSVFFFNPCTKETLNLPLLEASHRSSFQNMSFSSPPTSSDCTVFAVSGILRNVQLLTYRKDQDSWTQFEFVIEEQHPFVNSQCNAIFHDGKFCCLGKDGQLGVFDRNMETESQWRVHPTTLIPAFSSSRVRVAECSRSSFMVEYNDEIISVFVCPVGKRIWVFKLDKSDTDWKWVEIKSIGNKVIFLSNATSVMIPAGLKGIENRIYLPRSLGEGIIYHSLTTGKYHCFGFKDSFKDWNNTSESWNCIWFQPTNN